MKSELEHKYEVGDRIRFPDDNKIRNGKVKSIIFSKYNKDSYNVIYRAGDSFGHTKTVREKYILPPKTEEQ